MSKKWIAVWLVVFFGVTFAYAEMRIWTSVKGDTIEAEFIKKIGTDIIMKTA